MQWKDAARHTRLYLIAVLVMLAGSVIALGIYQTAEEEQGSVLGYMIIDGHAYPISPDDSKTYRHDMELYGGKWNVVADQIVRWFTGLWKGRTLAYTLAFITIGISLGFFLAARISHAGHDQFGQRGK